MTVKEWYKSIGLDWDNSSHTIKVETTGSQGVCPVYLDYDAEADEDFNDIVVYAIRNIEDSIQEDADDYIQDVCGYESRDELDKAVANGDITEDDACNILDAAFMAAEFDSGEWYIWVEGTEKRYDLKMED